LTISALAFDREPGRPPPNAQYVEGQLLVKFDTKTAKASIAAAHAEVGATEMRSFGNVEGLSLVKLQPGVSVDEALERYRKRPDVKYVSRDYVRRLAAVPNDPRFLDGSLWALQNNGQGGGTPGVDIGATKAWDLTTGSRDVVIPVIDSGIDYNHPYLAANMWRNVADCYTDGIDHDGNGYINDCYGINPAYRTSNPMDDTIDSHGTHVAGDIGAVGNNSEGVVGVAWQVSLMACKAFDHLEQGSDANIIACLDYVHVMKQRGVNIIATNNSYGGAGYDPALYDAIAAQMNDGTLFITTAGDTAFDGDNPDGAFYPRDYDLPNIVSATAIDRYDKMWRYSGFGRHTVHLCAPGDIIWSTVRGGG
jgi:subtilisin family serine protease